ncbi:hypothetical protein LY474_09400 [Myxococcus stipitatus]|uniref:hypothetical protein n=1 Tax=Myxococcus stipitatus TaxID=83455 RepID=UPI001F350FBB|nr:hypothetical protein [Myxococcus stipitatus]MCE9668026.1 hypothetical protein [Myxococcus stipitatus]
MTQGKNKGLLGRPVRWAGLSVAMLTAPTAFAAECPTPTLEQCANVDYRADTCGSVHDAYCQQLVESEWKARWEASPKQVAEMPEEMGGKPRKVGTQAWTPGATRFQGMDQSLAGQVLKGQVLYLKNLENLTKAEKAYFAQLEGWDKNGTQLTSCQEYVHEKYYGFSRFEQRAGRYGDDARAFFDAAYGKEGIAHRTLYSLDEQALAPIWNPQQRVAKNAYFRFVPGAYPQGAKPYVFESEAAKLAENPEAREWAVASDSWHQEMNEVFSGVPDDVLDQRQREQEEFTALLARRESVYQEWLKTAELLRSRDHDTKALDAAAAERLYGLDKAIEEGLVKAQARGCLDASSPTPCDWSPRRYKEMLEEAMAPRRAADLRACLFLTGNDFSAESFVRNADKLDIKALDQKDYTLDSRLLEEYLETYGTHVAALDAPVDPPTGATRHGGEAGDSGYAGDNTFGGGYSYKAGWEVSQGTAPLRAATLGPWCESNVRLYGEFTGYVNVFSPTPFELAHVHGEAATEGNGLRFKVNARVMGLAIVGLDQHYPLRFTFASDTPFFKRDAAYAATTFVVWFIPVTIKGGVSADTGIKVDIGGAVTRDCALDLVGIDVVGSITPYLAIKGFVSVGIGIPFLQVAVRGEVTLTRVNLPLTSDIGIYLSSPSHPTNPNTLFLRLKAGLDLEVRFLDGTILLYAEMGDLSAQFPVFSWSGFGMKTNIFTETVAVPLARLF